MQHFVKHERRMRNYFYQEYLTISLQARDDRNAYMSVVTSSTQDQLVILHNIKWGHLCHSG